MRREAAQTGADFPEEVDTTPESAGLWAISQGFTEVGKDDEEILERASFLYDSLYAHLKHAAGSGFRRARASSRLERAARRAGNCRSTRPTRARVLHLP